MKLHKKQKYDQLNLTRLPYFVLEEVISFLRGPLDQPFPPVISEVAWHRHPNLIVWGSLCKSLLKHLQTYLTLHMVAYYELPDTQVFTLYAITKVKILENERWGQQEKEHYCIPPQVTAIWYRGRYIRRLQFASTSCLTHLTIAPAREYKARSLLEPNDLDIHQDTLPSSITHLKLLHYDYPGTISYLPPKLTHFIWEGAPSLLQVSTFPSSITHLELCTQGWCSEIPDPDTEMEIQLPPNLKHFAIGVNTKKPLCFPPNVVSITLTNMFTQQLSNLPVSLQEVIMLTNWYESELYTQPQPALHQIPIHTLVLPHSYSVGLENLPATLVRLVAGFKCITSRIFSNSPLLKKVWIRRPSNAQEITIQTPHDIKLYSSYYRTYRMDSIHEVQLSNLYSDKFQFPPNCTHLYLEKVFVSQVDLVYFPLQLTHLVVGSYYYIWKDDEVLPQSLTHLTFDELVPTAHFSLRDIEEPITKLQNLIYLNIPDPKHNRVFKSFPPKLKELRLTVDDEYVETEPNIRRYRVFKPQSLLFLTIVKPYSDHVYKTFYL